RSCAMLRRADNVANVFAAFSPRWLERSPWSEASTMLRSKEGVMNTRFADRFLFGVFAVFILDGLLPVAVWSQTNTGRLVGTVYDATGAVVPGAGVVVTDNKTKRERTATSDEGGSFIAPFLDIGDYTVTVTAPGFKTFTAGNVVIAVGRDFPLTVRLEVGAAAAAVEVIAGPALVNATSAELNTTISSTQMLELPLISKNP